MKTAKLIKDNLEDVGGYAALYKLSDPLADKDRIEHEYVVVKTINDNAGLPKTTILPASNTGKVLSEQSLVAPKTTYAQVVALGEAGYTLTK